MMTIAKLLFFLLSIIAKSKGQDEISSVELKEDHPHNITAPKLNYAIVDGCPSILDVLSQPDGEYDINCVCDIDNDALNETLISVGCFNVTDLSDLVKAAQAVKKSGKILYSVGINGSQLDSNALHGGFFAKLGETPERFSISLCPENSPIQFDDDFFSRANVEKLRNFEVDGCQIATSKEGRVPKVIQKLKNLRMLILRNAGLEVVKNGDLAGLKNLEFLSLKLNNLSRIEDDAFKDTPNIRSLVLTLNSLEKSSLKSLSPLNKLQTLDLSNNFITLSNENAFSKMPYLESIRLSTNLIDRLPKGIFVGLENLTELYLDSNLLNETSFPKNQAVFPAKLRVLNLGSNALTDIPDLAAAGSPNLTYLILTNNDFPTIKAGRLQKLQNLRSLYLDQIFELTLLEPGAFKSLNKLHNLVLAHDNITDFDSEKLFDPENQVSYLSLKDNQLSEGHFGAGSLKQLKRLSSLDLSSNGLKNLAPGTLDEVKNLFSLIIDDNPFVCDKNIIYLVKWLKNNTSNEKLAFDFRQDLAPTCKLPLEFNMLPLAAVLLEHLG